MKLLLATIFSILVLQSCSNRKQRDIRKLSWYEITADARNKQVTVLVEEKDIEYWRAFYNTFKDSLAQHFSVSAEFKGIGLSSINDSIKNFTTKDLVVCNGQDLAYSIDQQLLLGPIDKLMPFGKKEFAGTDAFRFSNGVATRGFAVPVNILKNDSIHTVFLAIPKKTKNQSGAIVVLDAMLHACEKAVHSHPNE
jgi:hypothetical protein